MTKRLMLLSEYRETRFTPGSRPSINTLKRWINDGELPGKRIGGLYYVEVDTESQSIGKPRLEELMRELGV